MIDELLKVQCGFYLRDKLCGDLVLRRLLHLSEFYLLEPYYYCWGLQYPIITDRSSRQKVSKGPKVHSTHLCLFCCLAYRVIIAIFLNSEWIRKLWYIYTMEYYSAIKKNTFESVLMRLMKLEPIIQGEVSQKEKHQYSILTHLHGI